MPSFMGNMSGAVSGSASGGLNPSLPVGSSIHAVDSGSTAVAQKREAK